MSVSQSGETMDTLMAVKYAREQGARTLSICNTQGSTIPRESDAVLYIHAGPGGRGRLDEGVRRAGDRAVPARACTSRQRRGTLDAAAGRRAASKSCRTSRRSSTRCSSRRRRRIAEFAPWLGDTQSVLFLGRHVGYPVALEGALKLKEVAYIHAEGFAAGELKHGPIALIEPGQIVIVLVPSPRHENSLHPKVVSNIQEIRARGARVIAIAEIGDVAVVPFADEVIRIPFAGPLFEPLLGGGAAAHLRDGAGHREGPRRRPAAQPGQVGHGRVARCRVRAARVDHNGHMSIAGIGVDVVDLSAFERALVRTPALRDRLFAESERDLPLRSLAGRFAAKEALIKALGESSGVQWHDMVIVSNDRRQPVAACCRAARAEIVARQGITRHPPLDVARRRRRDRAGL